MKTQPLYQLGESVHASFIAEVEGVEITPQGKFLYKLKAKGILSWLEEGYIFELPKIEDFIVEEKDLTSTTIDNKMNKQSEEKC